MALNPYESPANSAPAESPQRDWSAFVARYLVWLGVIELLGFNLGGALWIWFSFKIRNHNPRFRLATLIICGIMVLSGLAMILAVLLRGTEGMSTRILSITILKDPSDWVVYAIAIAIVLIHAVPAAALLDPATRSHFHGKGMPKPLDVDSEKIRETARLDDASRFADEERHADDRCPKCGTAINLVTRQGLRSDSGEPWRLICVSCAHEIDADQLMM